jgi:hypothetical protein
MIVDKVREYEVLYRGVGEHDDLITVQVSSLLETRAP